MAAGKKENQSLGRGPRQTQRACMFALCYLQRYCHIPSQILVDSLGLFSRNQVQIRSKQATRICHCRKTRVTTGKLKKMLLNKRGLSYLPGFVQPKPFPLQRHSTTIVAAKRGHPPGKTGGSASSSTPASDGVLGKRGRAKAPAPASPLTSSLNSSPEAPAAAAAAGKVGSTAETPVKGKELFTSALPGEFAGRT